MKEHDANVNVETVSKELMAKEKLQKEIKEARDAARLNVTGLNNRLTELKNVSESSMTAFHPHMPQVLDEIQRSRTKFNQMPIGPLGSFVKIKKEEWSKICEQLFGRRLNGFLVSNYHDSEILRDILKRRQW